MNTRDTTPDAAPTSTQKTDTANRRPSKVLTCGSWGISPSFVSAFNNRSTLSKISSTSNLVERPKDRLRSQVW